MRVLGLITSGVIVVVVITALVVVVMSIPDIKRYLRIREM